MSEFALDCATLGEIIGSPEMVQEMLNSQRKISKSQAQFLAIFFQNLSSGLALKVEDFY